MDDGEHARRRNDVAHGGADLGRARPARLGARHGQRLRADDDLRRVALAQPQTDDGDPRRRRPEALVPCRRAGAAADASPRRDQAGAAESRGDRRPALPQDPLRGRASLRPSFCRYHRLDHGAHAGRSQGVPLGELQGRVVGAHLRRRRHARPGRGARRRAVRLVGEGLRAEGDGPIGRRSGRQRRLPRRPAGRAAVADPNRRVRHSSNSRGLLQDRLDELRARRRVLEPAQPEPS